MFKWEKFLPPDKSFLIRALLFSLLTNENVVLQCDSEISADAESAIEIIKSCGKKISTEKDKITITGSWTNTNPILNAGNSATAMRIMLGIALHLKKPITITGDNSLFARNHSIFISFMKEFGAQVSVRQNSITIEKISETPNLSEVTLPVQSAQLKSFLILSLLENGTHLKNCGKTRNYTEIILKEMGAEITAEKTENITVKPLNQKLKAYAYSIPKDASSLFIAISAAISAKTDMEFNKIVVDETRLMPFKILQKCGYNLEFKDNSVLFKYSDTVKQEKITCTKEIIPQIIDEIPFLAFIVPLKGTTLILEEISWLKNKESDRIRETIKRISSFFKTELTENTLTIFPERTKTRYKKYHSNDHRMEMLSAVTALYKNKDFHLNGEEKISFPYFGQFLEKLKTIKEITLKRNQLDLIDNKIMSLLEKRFNITDSIQQIKKKEKIEITDCTREHLILTRADILYNSEKIKNIYKEIFKNSKN